MGGVAEELHGHGFVAAHGGAVGGDGEPLSGIEFLRELEHFGCVEVGYLNQLQIAGTGGFEGAVEVFGMGIVHKHVEFEAFMVGDEGAAHFDVAQMRADEDLAACIVVVYIGI